MKLSLFVFLFFICVTTVFAQGDLPAGKLPGDVVPVSYALSLTVVPTQDNFSGSVKIGIDIKKELSGFWMHGKEIQSKESTLTLANGESMPVTYKQVNDDGVVWIGFSKPVSPQQATLSITYDAPFNHTLNGLYRVDAGSEAYAFTQFENINARLCFPSFDEPGFKTPYDITVTARKQDSVITNTMPIKEEDAGGGMKRIQFERTPKLPTYLVAFVVGPVDIVKGNDIGADEIRSTPIPFRIITTKGKGSQTAYALKTAPQILQVLERYFGVPYPYTKLDLIAVPDFEAGAMENAATITYREWALLLDENNAPEGQKRYFANTMAHEMAHQWFGDLVTMAWWDDVWLNESFATWIAARAVKTWDPSSHESTSAVEDSRGVMEIDSMVAARQVRQPINNTGDIAIAINWITYAKGGAVIAMFEQYLGEETFRKGIQRYIQKYRDSNATTDDFLNTISEVAQKDIAGPFRTFLFQPGVPLIDAKISCEGNQPKLILKQQRYLPAGSKGNPNQVWQIPVCYKYPVSGKVTRSCNMLTKAVESFPLETGGGCPEWVLPNADGSGYYRFSVRASDYPKMEQSVNDLTVVDQLAIADSIRSGFQSGRLSAAEVYASLDEFANSKSEQVAKAPIELLEFSHEHIVPASALPKFEAFAGNLYHSAYQRVGFDQKPGMDEDSKLLRASVVPFLAFVARDPAVRQEAKKRGFAYVGYGTDNKIHRDAVDVNLVSACLGVAVEESDSKFFDFLFSLLKQSDDPVLRQQLMAGITSTTDPALVNKALDLSLDPAIRSNEIANILGGLLDHVENQDLTWEWLKKNMPQLAKKLSIEGRMYIPFMASRFCSAEKARDVEAFFGPQLSNIPAGKMVLSAVLERISLCEAAVKIQQPSALAFFEKGNPPSSTTSKSN